MTVPGSGCIAVYENQWFHEYQSFMATLIVEYSWESVCV